MKKPQGRQAREGSGPGHVTPGPMLGVPPSSMIHDALVTGVHDFWLNVLLQAIKDRLANSLLIQGQAQRWLESDASELGSPRWVCDELGLDADAVRRAVAFSALPEFSGSPSPVCVVSILRQWLA